MHKMKASLDEGVSVWIYPEGTRNKTDRPLAEFSDGAFHLAVASGKPIAPLTIIDTGKILPAGKGIMMPGKVMAYWDEPIPTEGLDKKDVPALREKVREIMLAHFKQ
jgi:1-acyl-sn-glycerol-3-phosphate acyltransferase